IDRAMNEAAERNLQPAARPAIRPSAAVAPAAAAVQPAPVMQAPKAMDPIAQTIREAEMERELEIPAPRAAAPLQQPAPQQETFRPQSKIFAPAPEAPAMRPAPVQQQAPAPVMSQPVISQPVQQQPVRQEPIIRQAPEPMRMPKVEDFPPVVQAELDHRTQPASAHAAEERGPMGLLKRITNSLGRRDDDAVAADMTAAPPAASQQRRPLSPEASLYAPRRGNLDDQGRAVPQARMMQEDYQLEIPAFLRRQSN
ncbi:cell division protein FtsZ, partial [Rhizobium ruizarguesonis]